MNAIVPKPVGTQSDSPRLLGSLNEDCLIYLCEFLSFWDIVNIAKTSPQLAAFADANVFPKRARNCLLFANYTDRIPNSQRTSLSKFSEAMQFLGPHLTHLSLSGVVFDMSPDNTAENIVNIILDNCPRLNTLRLEELHMQMDIVQSSSATRRKRRLQMQELPDGGRYPQLQELCMTECCVLGDDWFTFIGQLSGLQSLVLHQCLPSKRQTGPLKYLTCNALRVLSVVNASSGHVADNMGIVIAPSRETLRVLDFDLNATALNASFGETMLPPLMKHLETVVVFPTSKKLAPIEQLQHLRKIIVRKFEKLSAVPRWLVQLAVGPHCIEHIVLMTAGGADAVWEIVRLFSAGLRVLEVNRHWSVKLLCYMPRLHTLRISHCGMHLEPALLAAIRDCPELSDVIVTDTVDLGHLRVAQLVEALRERTNGGDRQLRLHFFGCSLEGSDKVLTFSDDVLVHPNADILELVVKLMPKFCNGVGFMRIEEFIISPNSFFGN